MTARQYKLLTDSIIDIKNALGNMPNGYAEAEEVRRDTESGSPEDASRFQAGLAMMELERLEKLIRRIAKKEKP